MGYSPGTTQQKVARKRGRPSERPPRNRVQNPVRLSTFVNFTWSRQLSELPSVADRQANHVARVTHWARQVGASNGSAKYWVSCDTFPSRNSMMLTVKRRFAAVVDLVLGNPELALPHD